MQKDLFDSILEFLRPEMDDARARKALVEGALVGCSVLEQIDWEGAADTFTKGLVRQLEAFGQIAPGQPALAALLEEIKRGADVDRQAVAEALLARLRERPADTASPLPPPLRALLALIESGEEKIVLSEEEARACKAHDPANLTEYRLCRIAEWAQAFDLDKRFVNLTMIVDKGEREPQRWQGLPAEDFQFNDLRAVLEKRAEDRALVVLGAPGSGKSTLLRRLQLDHGIDQVRAGGHEISFFLPLNSYREENGERPEPGEWLRREWARKYPGLSMAVSLETKLRQGRVLLLLDALNEMPHKGAEDYEDLVQRWQAFVQEAVERGNRVLFSCRRLDYSASLSTEALRVPQIEVQPMNARQVREFIAAYAPEHRDRIWDELDGSPQLEFFKTPYFLWLLCEQVNKLQGELPKGRAGLFTGFVRQALDRECILRKEPLFRLPELLDERDRGRLSRKEWSAPYDLPERGVLIPKLSELAWKMQETRRSKENAQLRVKYDEALALLAHARGKDILQAGAALHVLDDDSGQDDILFYHQLLQEYFAARRLAREPKPELAHVEWHTEKVAPSLADTLAGLADGDPLPPIAQTGWEETTLTAAPMAADPARFIRDLIPHNLPLAARCAASPEVQVDDDLKQEIREALIARTQDPQADLRARIAAGEALGTIGDPRFVRKKGAHGDYLLPPMVEIPAGKYPIGDDESDYKFEKPAHTVELSSFQIGQFPVTNAEYQLFLDAGGYEDERWWDTDESKAWLRGEAAVEGQKQSWRDYHKRIQGWPDDWIQTLFQQNRITSKQVEELTEQRGWTTEQLEKQLEEWFPEGTTYREPRFWNDPRFNNPASPVVGVSWFEARAYCNWLTANAAIQDHLFRLPTEVEFEAAARGIEGRVYPYGPAFDATKGNTFESHIRRTTPIGVFENKTPEGAYDLSGNAYTWTLSIYDQERFAYPYRKDDGREDIHQASAKRVLRGGSFVDLHDYARAVYRLDNRPAYRGYNFGFRLFCGLRPPSS